MSINLMVCIKELELPQSSVAIYVPITFLIDGQSPISSTELNSTCKSVSQISVTMGAINSGNESAQFTVISVGAPLNTGRLVSFSNVIITFWLTPSSVHRLSTSHVRSIT